MDPATRAALEEAAAAEQPELRPVSLPGGEAKSGVTP